MTSFDELLLDIGEFGRYQLFVYLSLAITSIPTAFRQNLAVFLTPKVKYRCSLPLVKLLDVSKTARDDEFVPKSSSISALVNATVPIRYNNITCSNEYAQCEIFGENGTVEKCRQWVFDTSTFASTATEDYELVCEWAEWSTYTMMAPMFGMLVGGIVFGSLSDRFGRKGVIVFNNFCQVVVVLLCAWAPNLPYFMFFRFLESALSSGMYLALFVLAMELMGPSKRMWAGVCLNFFWVFGIAILSGLAYGIRYRHYLQLACALPPLFFFPIIWIVPESPRWLLTQGRFDEAMSIIKTMAKYNRTRIPEKFYDATVLCAKDEKDKKQIREKLWQLCTSPKLALRSVVVVFNWISVTLMYYGLMMFSGDATGDVHFSFFIGGLVEFPANIICILLLNRIGRRFSLSALMLVGGVSCLCSIFPVVFSDSKACQGGDLNLASYILSLVGRLGATGAFTTIYVFTSELFPTSLRNSAVGFSSMSARFGGIAAPYFARLNIGGKFGMAFPLLIFGVFSTTAGLLSLFLPETFNQKLPDTVHDAQVFGRKVKASQVMSAVNAEPSIEFENTRL